MRAIRAHLLVTAVLTASLSCSDDSGPASPGVLPTQDVTPPAQIVGPTLSYPVVDGAAVLSWIAPADDTEPHTVHHYEIRYGYSFPLNWDLALTGENPPEALEPGAAQTWSLADPLRGRVLYAAIRSFDASGNASPISDIAHFSIPGYQLSARCADVMSAAPAQGLEATITGRHVYEHVTDSNGAFGQSDLAGIINVAVRNGASVTTYHHISDAFVLESDVDLFYSMIPYQLSPSTLYDNTLGLLVDAATGLGTDMILRKWETVPVDIFVPTFTNGNGVDYTALSTDAIDRWELRTGIDLFRVVGSVPPIGIEMQFLSREDMGIQNGVTMHFQDAQGFPERNVVQILDEFEIVGEVKLFTILLHELGHTIRLNHLPSGFIMFGGQPLPLDISEAEVLVVRLHNALPNAMDLSVYDFSAPSP